MDPQSAQATRTHQAPIPCPQCGNPDPTKIIKCPYCRYVPGTKQLRRAPAATGLHRATVPGIFLAGALVEIVAISLLVAIDRVQDAAPPAIIVVWVLAGTGCVLLLVASVAAGVSIGIRSARRTDVTLGDPAPADPGSADVGGDLPGPRSPDGPPEG